MHVSHKCIRTINFNGLKIGGETSFPILKPLYALNLSVFNIEDNFDIVKSYFKTEKAEEMIMAANSSDCDIIGLKFNIKELPDIKSAVDLLKKCLEIVEKPIMISGSGNDETDRLLLPQLIQNTDREVIVNSANENTYKDIVSVAAAGNHVVVLKSPIDINLAKELNILSSDLGLSLDKILVDTDIGGLGYGLEYGYSIMEKIKLEGLGGDNYLNMPMISFACFESLKTKEAKTELNDDSWGNCKDRAEYFELIAASAVKACGANIIVMNYPPNISVMKGLVE